MHAKEFNKPIIGNLKSTENPNSFFAGLLDDFQKLKKQSAVNDNEHAGKKHRRNRGSEDTQEKPVNKYAALDSEDVSVTKSKSMLIADNFVFSKVQLSVWNCIQEGLQLSNSIQSCDLPSDDPKNSLMVKVVQDQADKILADTKMSWVNKILQIAVISKNMGFGNCQEKAFYAFAYMFNLLSDPTNAIRSLRLATFHNHFILIVNEEFLMDPWLDLAFPTEPNQRKSNIEYVFEGFGRLENYFSVNDKGICWAYKVIEGKESSIDVKSMQDLDSCLAWLKTKKVHFESEVSESVLKKPKKQDLEDFPVEPPELTAPYGTSTQRSIFTASSLPTDREKVAPIGAGSFSY